MAVSRLVIYPYKMGSVSAKRLAEKITTVIKHRVRRIREVGKYHPKARSIVLNWGMSKSGQWHHTATPYTMLNNSASVSRASNKLVAFGDFARATLPTPEWTADATVAQTWLNEGSIVLSRKLLTSHSGRGIIINNPEESNNLVRAPLYVKYKKKRKEFRVHVFNGQVIDLAEKRKFRVDRRPASFVSLVRNHDNGWAFCRDGITEPTGLRELAVQSVAALGLNFGACDIIWNEKENKCYTLEVNTAPGLEGTTLERYSQAIANYLTSGV